MDKCITIYSKAFELTQKLLNTLTSKVFLTCSGATSQIRFAYKTPALLINIVTPPTSTSTCLAIARTWSRLPTSQLKDPLNHPQSSICLRYQIKFRKNTLHIGKRFCIFLCCKFLNELFHILLVNINSNNSRSGRSILESQRFSNSISGTCDLIEMSKLSRLLPHDYRWFLLPKRSLFQWTSFEETQTTAPLLAQLTITRIRLPTGFPPRNWFGQWSLCHALSVENHVVLIYN